MKAQSSVAGWIYGKRTTQRKRIKTREFNIATWNVRSMLQAGKMEEIADELKKHNIQITALQGVRWPQDGWIKKKNYTLLYSGLKTLKGQHGTGFLITGCVTHCILGLPNNERMCKLRIKGKFYNMTIISVYAPTEDENRRNAENVEQFYSKLSDVCDITPRNDALILLGDFNAKIGKEHSNKRTAGRYTLHDITSENGEKLVQLAIAHNLEISSTKFQHTRIHKGTWKAPGQDICNQIDHVLINKRRAAKITDVRTLRGPNCDSDHYLVRTKIRQRISKVEVGTYRKSRKWVVTKLQNPDIKNKFEENIAQELNEIDLSPDIELEWDSLKTIINHVAYDDVGTRINTKMLDGLMKIVEKQLKNEAGKKCVI